MGVPQPALSTNMDAHTNVESLSFSLDTEQKTLPIRFDPGTDHQGPPPDPASRHQPAEPPARRSAVAGQAHRVRQGQRQAVADPRPC